MGSCIAIPADRAAMETIFSAPMSRTGARGPTGDVLTTALDKTVAEGWAGTPRNWW